MAAPSFLALRRACDLSIRLAPAFESTKLRLEPNYAWMRSGDSGIGVALKGGDVAEATERVGYPVSGIKVAP